MTWLWISTIKYLCFHLKLRLNFKREEVTPHKQVTVHRDLQKLILI